MFISCFWMHAVDLRFHAQTLCKWSSRLPAWWRIHAVIKRNSCTDRANAGKSLHSSFSDKYQWRISDECVWRCVWVFIGAQMYRHARYWLWHLGERASGLCILPALIRRTPELSALQCGSLKDLSHFPKPSLSPSQHNLPLPSRFPIRSVTQAPGIKKLPYYFCAFGTLSQVSQQSAFYLKGRNIVERSR